MKLEHVALNVSDPVAMAQLGSSVKWSQGSMDQLAARQYFDLVVMGGEVGTNILDLGRPALVEAIRRRYRLVRRLDCPPHLGVAYVPNTPADAGYGGGNN